MTKEITEKELKLMKTFDHLYQLKLVVVGEPVTQRQYDAIHYFYGDIFAKIPEPGPIADIRFTKDGTPYDASGLGNIESVNGKPIMGVLSSNQQIVSPEKK